MILGVIRMLRQALVRRPSPAMVVAVVALLVALAGPGYAALQSVVFAARAGNAEKVDGLKASKRPHGNEIVALDSHGRLPASVGAVGPQGVPGPQGAPGSPGAAGTALAYSTILYEPPDAGGPPEWRIDDTLSKKLDNDVNFAHPAPGVFCIHDLPSYITVMNAVATPGAFGPSGPFLTQVDVPRTGHSVNSSCPANTAAAIYVTKPDGTALEDPPGASDTIYFELS